MARRSNAPGPGTRRRRSGKHVSYAEKNEKSLYTALEKWGEHGTFDDFDVPNLTTIILDSQMIRIPDA